MSQAKADESSAHELGCPSRLCRSQLKLVRCIVVSQAEAVKGPTLWTLLQNSRSVMVQGFWWCPWKAAIWEPTTGVLPSP